MDENKKDISKLEGITNFEWIIKNYDPEGNYVSDLFSINGIPNVKWFIEFQSQYTTERFRDDGNDFVLFELRNEKNSFFHYNNLPVNIEISLGTVGKERRIFSIIVYGPISNFQNNIQSCELVQLLDVNCLHINLTVTPLNKIKNIISSSTNYNNFKLFLMSDHLSDVKFKIDNKEFPAHKIMLASASPVFEKMFFYQMKENITNTVEVNDTDPDVFKEMLNFIYTGNVDNLDSVAFGLFESANIYDISKLKIICEQHLENGLAVYNVISIFELADRYNSLHLKKKCIEYVDKNYTTIKETKDFKDLNKDLTMELLDAIITKAKLTEAS
ncbi:speckle-type POZ protein-like isoform X1 [Leptopilina boulardi]|uniref:speckle-type POZ protein-like isoform X1 n=1 Tax=Leptopilina boulardi TaxID=63433 RepID=UPI0021F5CFE0|nr:speckle-type POZ protein-like isoform X1 [Leptopilina boulardi]